MTEKRYFYTDPLAAAWQVKRHDMKLERSDGDLILCWDDMEDDLAMRIAGGQWDAHYYVHIGSLHLLEPKTDDVVEFAGEFDTVYDAAQLMKDGEKYRARPKNMVAGEHHFCKIIRRNDMPFMWPESEPA